MKSVMTHSFSQTPTIQAPRSRFDRSHGHKFTMDAGWLMPFYWDDVLPGDTFNLNTTVFARLATPYWPLMDNMMCDTHYFFVPYRLIWDNSKKFFGEQVDPGDSIDYQIPTLVGNVVSDAEPDLTTVNGRIGALLNILGVPDGIAPDDVDISALPYRAYSRIYSEWFRDQNLIDSTNLRTDDGPDNVQNAAQYVLLERRGKRHDYFTSALPWPQKGDAVTLPLGATAPVAPPNATTQIGVNVDTSGGRLDTFLQSGAFPSSNVETNALASAGTSRTIYWDLDATGLEADLSSATAATINDLREAFQVQKLLERDARGGTRYSEIVNNHFGVNFYDVSYRPEYLGGSSTPVNVNPVSLTATNATQGVFAGDQGAYATFSSRSGFSKSFVEHGIVMGFMSVRADLTYQQGLRRELSKSTRYDIYWPSLAHLGEQEILNKEIYCDGSVNDDDVFGYQERYAEYRYKQSQISGLFQSSAASTLDSWHLSQEFASLPTLGQTFIEENPPIDRVIIAATEPHFIVDSYSQLLCARPIPVFGVPGMIDHF